MEVSNSGLYDLAISELFLIISKGNASKNQYDFEKKDLEDAISALVKKRVLPKIIKNIPDIKYTYDARKDFPPAISAHGYWAIIGRGKSKYSFIRLTKNNLIRIPGDLPKTFKTKVIQDKTPAAVASVLGDDEQATFARVRYNDILGDFFGMSVYQVQSHERTTVSAGQIEIDEIYVGEDKNSQRYLIPISGKGGDKDCLSYSQAYNLNLYSTQKLRYAGLIPLPIGIVKKANGHIWIIRFSTHCDVSKIKILEVGLYIVETNIKKT